MSTVGNTAILPYGTTPQSPVITLPDTLAFKNDRTREAANYFDSALHELNERYNQLVALAKDSEMVYNARYNFVPKVGFTYYLYDTGKDYLLTLIDDWDKYRFIGAFTLTNDNVWKRVDGSG
jgi:hypothetical protein